MVLLLCGGGPAGHGDRALLPGDMRGRAGTRKGPWGSARSGRAGGCRWREAGCQPMLTDALSPRVLGGRRLPGQVGAVPCPLRAHMSTPTDTCLRSASPGSGGVPVPLPRAPLPHVGAEAAQGGGFLVCGAPAERRVCAGEQDAEPPSALPAATSHFLDAQAHPSPHPRLPTPPDGPVPQEVLGPASPEQDPLGSSLPLGPDARAPFGAWLTLAADPACVRPEAAVLPDSRWQCSPLPTWCWDRSARPSHTLQGSVTPSHEQDCGWTGRPQRARSVPLVTVLPPCVVTAGGTPRTRPALGGWSTQAGPGTSRRPLDRPQPPALGRQGAGP